MIHRQRDEFRKMLHSVADNGHTLEDCHRYLTRPESKHDIFFMASPTSDSHKLPPHSVSPRHAVGHLSGAVQLDPGFVRFRAWCDTQAIPFVILSRSAMTSPLHFTRTRTHTHIHPAVWPPSSTLSSPNWRVKIPCGIRRSSQTMWSCVLMDDGRSDFVIQRGPPLFPRLCFLVPPLLS